MVPAGDAGIFSKLDCPDGSVSMKRGKVSSKP